MIYRREILNNQECPPELELNLLDLLIKINKVRDAFSRPMYVTSGYRSKIDQERIYKAKGFTRKKIPWKSLHLSCEAVDIADPDKVLQKWCIENEKLLAEIGLWMEQFEYTPNWCHFQTAPPQSGSRFFKPY